MIITIVTAVKNGEKTILDSINSINSQTYKKIEHVIVDSISTDGTLALVKKYAKNNSIVISEHDDGIYDGINKGILNSNGEIIGILNADDFYADVKVVEEVANEFSNKNINFIYADLEYIEKNSNKICRRWKSGHLNLRKVKFGWMPPHPTIFFRKSLIENLGLFNIEYKISADYDFMLRYLLSKETNIGYIPRVIVKMRTGGASNGSLKSVIIKSLEDYKIIRKHKIGGLISLLAKNLRKLPQFFQR